MTVITMRSLVGPLALLCLAQGCAGASARWGGTARPAPCPKGAIKEMKARDIWPGDSAGITIDRYREDDMPVTLHAGPVEGVLFTKLGPLPPGTILFGHIWTEEPEVVVRYHEAIDASGTRFPFCAVAIDGLNDGLVKLPGSAPGQAILRDAQSALWVVDTFRDNASLLEDTRAQLFR